VDPTAAGGPSRYRRRRDRPGRSGARRGRRTGVLTAVPPTTRRTSVAVSWVAVCIVLAGLFTYGYQALVARSLTEAQFGGFGAYWSAALIVGFGGFLPLELELARRLQRPGEPRLPSGALSTVAGLLVLAVAVVLLVTPALGRIPLLPLLGICAVSSVQYPTRGLMLGTNRLPLHGAVLLVDSGLRVGLAALVAVLIGSAGVDAFAWTLVVAIAVAHTPVLAWLSRRVGRPLHDERVAVAERPAAFRGAVGHLLVGTLCAQVLLNIAPVVVTGLAGAGQADVAGRFIACFTLVRLPLFVAVPLQSALVPSLTRLLASGEAGRLRALVLRLAVGTAVVTAVGALLGLVAGPALRGAIRPPRRLDRAAGGRQRPLPRVARRLAGARGLGAAPLGGRRLARRPGRGRRRPRRRPRSGAAHLPRLRRRLGCRAGRGARGAPARRCGPCRAVTSWSGSTTTRPTSAG
jgi:hypothetical protein